MGGTLGGYWKETRRPIYSAALVLPFFMIYHAGTLFLRTTYLNGADALIIRVLSAFSVQSMFASALVLLACFVIWQLRTRASWKIDSGKLAALFVESLGFALLLYFAFGWLSVHLIHAAAVPATPARMERLVLYCGAGIYEELVFRGFLLGLLLLILKRLVGMKPTAAAAVAVLIAAGLFSLFHYIGPASDAFTLASFVQRMMGGLYFSLLFVTRGFGLTAASHALYDIIVGLIS